MASKKKTKKTPQRPVKAADMDSGWLFITCLLWS